MSNGRKLGKTLPESASRAKFLGTPQSDHPCGVRSDINPMAAAMTAVHPLADRRGILPEDTETPVFQGAPRPSRLGIEEGSIRR